MHIHADVVTSKQELRKNTLATFVLSFATSLLSLAFVNENQPHSFKHFFSPSAADVAQRLDPAV